MEKSFAKRVQIELIAVIHATWGRTVSDGDSNLFRSLKQFKTISLCKFSYENLSTLTKTEALSAVFRQTGKLQYSVQNNKANGNCLMEHLVKRPFVQCFLWQHLKLHNLVCSVFFFWRRNDEKKIFHHKANRWNICSTLSGVFSKVSKNFKKEKPSF